MATLTATLLEREASLKAVQAEVVELRSVAKKSEELLMSKDEEIAGKDKIIQEARECLAGKDKVIQEARECLACRDNSISEAVLKLEGLSGLLEEARASNALLEQAVASCDSAAPLEVGPQPIFILLIKRTLIARDHPSFFCVICLSARVCARLWCKRPLWRRKRGAQRARRERRP